MGGPARRRDGWGAAPSGGSAAGVAAGCDGRDFAFTVDDGGVPGNRRTADKLGDGPVLGLVVERLCAHGHGDAELLGDFAFFVGEQGEVELVDFLEEAMIFGRVAADADDEEVNAFRGKLNESQMPRMHNVKIA